MKHKSAPTMALMALAVIGVLLWLLYPRAQNPVKLPALTPEASPQAAKSAPESTPIAKLPGERILAGYGSPGTNPEQDLTLMYRLLEAFRTVAKQPDALPLGSNGEIAAALRGEGRWKEPLLPPYHPVFNQQGQILDRWQTPLFFHAESAQKLSVRSAGPDRQLFTADDFHRQPDGRFLRGGELNPVSLFGPE